MSAFTFSFSFGANTNNSADSHASQTQKNDSYQSVSLQQQKPQQKASIFQNDNQDLNEEDEYANLQNNNQKNQKVRTGYANVTKSSEQIGRNTSNMAVKQHKKHQVVDAYFSSKIEELEKTEKEKEMQKMFDNEQVVSRVLQSLSSSKEQEQQMIENYSIKCKEYDNLVHMMNQAKKKVKVCYACNRMFASAEHLRRHEKESQMHKDNEEKLKIAQNILLL
ncbi:UNKNOWN [Stylonychia lemnae]|uniref:C2H2-type domain-containing protein n=1 Tax=Stylonychia lemnae TaxID=5949 RepID=A0A078AA58_STYLE|nr:UNKNOWN [Stylonychia lemnae]|eukprot:CDW77698.1 UNKNOWN [Stylonychia lemnae]